RRWDVTQNTFTLELEDLGPSVVDPATLVLQIAGVTVPTQTSKSGTLTTVVHDAPLPFTPGAILPFSLKGRDTRGLEIGTEATVTVPSPPFPLTGLGGPAGQAGTWGVRQVWNAGRADAVVTAVEIARAAGLPGFAGGVLDTQEPVINFNFTTSPGNGGWFADDVPFPAEAQGLPAQDWITVARGRVHIPRDGDWTFGVHSDDGFALRVAGHPFASVSGLGALDPDFPEFVGFAVGTGDSNTRAVLKGVRAGEYTVEFIHFQRVGGAFAEIYAAEGEFLEDGDTGSWALIGAADGLQLVTEPAPIGPFSLDTIRVEAATITIEFASPRPGGAHVLLESTTLSNWSPVSSAQFVSTGGQGMRCTVAQPSGDVRYYRVEVSP
ncbi:MAG: hypothetical protein J0L84_16455, partial [Verrucomicrobia bacterium]|nr:hypothetical protein [Verrucomicrobiota bacterium]